MTESEDGHGALGKRNGFEFVAHGYLREKRRKQRHDKEGAEKGFHGDLVEMVKDCSPFGAMVMVVGWPSTTMWMRASSLFDS